MQSTQNNKKRVAALSVKLEPEVKTMLSQTAERRGMDLSKLARAVLTNWVKPNTYSL